MLEFLLPMLAALLIVDKNLLMLIKSIAHLNLFPSSRRQRRSSLLQTLLQLLQLIRLNRQHLSLAHQRDGYTCSASSAFLRTCSAFRVEDFISSSNAANSSANVSNSSSEDFIMLANFSQSFSFFARATSHVVIRSLRAVI